eukprot:scaffold83710_cov32-Tisochrysis_lutea.AAC.3
MDMGMRGQDARSLSLLSRPPLMRKLMVKGTASAPPLPLATCQAERPCHTYPDPSHATPDSPLETREERGTLPINHKSRVHCTSHLLGPRIRI